jgi:REP element-mobilizing transposase RayT
MYEIGGVEDHVHVLVRGKTNVSAAEMARNIKSRSSAWLRETFDGLGSFAWQEGYGVFSVSKSQVEGVKAYIQRQEEHHRSRGFKEEFIEFLERHEIEYKPEFVFD